MGKINYCLPINPCQNNGECEDDRFAFSCQCSKYWSGVNCTRPQTKFAVKEVKMKIDDHEGGGGCGGDDSTVQIKVNNKCTTKAKRYPVGQTITWTKEELEDCATNN